MGKRILTFLCILVLFSFFLSGCYYFSCMKEMKSAEQLISELKAAGGPTLVPYEYTSAEKFLEVAKEEAGEADWKSAQGFATRAKSAAQAGLDEVKKKK
jgi:hypothetical protein